MATTHTHTLPVLISVAGDEFDISAMIEYSITKRSPARGPSFSSGGEPAEPAEITFLDVRLLIQNGAVVKTVPCPDWLYAFISGSDDVYNALGESCNWGERECDPDEAYERQRDEI